ncbi:MAG: hypothetical protein COV52_09450 [Gammaproteobacteria bacterium CG11_big_fil_rev_8_21_14_0_20_46_22]|nr:MAG: hypothetical protein COW05_03560 [Gammaproteobacteria bacterium CG12_big_fil_rev_8_21_14_0_65_46_12]PIR10274.1 MAG: hypothetical protein COV52_09450 [Gammaproteobacteria bacterium CG11_big_fil_rev_8_21_14_0_20_46_22]
MRKLLTTLLAICLLSGVAFAKTKAPLEWLFVLNADQAQVVPAGQKAKLVLVRPSKNVLAFTNRPNRKMMQIKTRSFVQNWTKGFGHDEPNGAYVHSDLVAHKDGTVTPVAAELMNPHFEQGRLVFDMKSLDGKGFKPQRLKDVSVFIDDYPCASFMDCPL